MPNVWLKKQSKIKENGNFVYSFSSEEQGDKKRKPDAQQTLHAAVSSAEDTANIELSDNNIPQPTPKVNTKLSFPMYPTLPDATNVEAELNERDWGFEWTDENIPDKIAKT